MEPEAPDPAASTTAAAEPETPATDGKPRRLTVKMVDGKPAIVLDSNVREDQTSSLLEATFAQGGGIEPPYPFDALSDLVEHSSLLRPCIDAYATNIDGFGHRFEPRINFGRPDAVEALTAVLRARKMRAAQVAALAGQDAPSLDVTPAEIAAARVEIEREMAAEKLKLDAFFDGLNPDRSFVALRKLKREEMEKLGNGYWEIVRDPATGEPQQINYVPAFTVRTTAPDREPTWRTFKTLGPDLEYHEYKQCKFFRRYVQVFNFIDSSVFTQGGFMAVHFKEYGDPRTMSATTGQVFADVKALRAAEGENARVATEIMHYKIPDPRYPYGLPRWIGAMLGVMGTRAAEEVNYEFFDQNAIPAFLLLIAGGQFTETTKSDLKKFIDGQVRGRANAHKGIAVEAMPDPGAVGADARPRIDYKPLTNERQSEQTFGGYMERNADMVGQQFRLPRPIRGDLRDINRAAAATAIDLAELEIFGPERDEEDFRIDRTIMADLGIRYWRFVSRGPAMRDPERLLKAAVDGLREGALSVNEARDLFSDGTGLDYQRIEEPWADRPKNAPAPVEDPEDAAAGGNGAAGGPFAVSSDVAPVVPGEPPA